MSLKDVSRGFEYSETRGEKPGQYKDEKLRPFKK